MSVSMKFGAVGNITDTAAGMTLVKAGYLGGQNSDSITINMSAYKILLLFTRELNASTGAAAGGHIYMLTFTEKASTAYSKASVYASSSTNVTVTVATDETVTITPASSSYDVYYALYAVL